MIKIPRPMDVIKKRQEMLKDKTDKIIKDITDLLESMFCDNDCPLVNYKVADDVETLVINTVMTVFQANGWDVSYECKNRILSFKRAAYNSCSGYKD